jgi:uncharacterized delta-60 repeat protein
MKPNLIRHLAVLALCSAVGTTHAAFGDPDSTFASPIAAPASCHHALGATGDATTYLSIRSLGPGGDLNGVAKLRKDGSIDTSWGQDGYALLPGIPEQGGISVIPSGFLATSDGGLIVIGARLVRFTRDGVRDAAYGVDGVSDPIEQSGFIHSFAPQADGSVVVFATGYNGGPQGVFTRITPGGKRDAFFGAQGVVSVDSTNREIYSWSVSGQHLEYASHPRDRVVGAPQLQLHGTSPSAGRIVAKYGAAAWTSPNVQVQPDGHLLLAAATCSSSAFCGSPTVSIVRYNSDGSVDTGFGSGGVRSVTPFPPEQVLNLQVFPRMLSLGPGGSSTVIVHGYEKKSWGWFPVGDYSADHAFRLAPDGSLDPAFPQSKRLASGQFVRYLQIDDGRVIHTPGSSQCPQRLTSDAFRMNVPLVEFHNPVSGRYFITAEGMESGVLDANTGADRWVRTGWKFGGWLAAALPGARQVCRFVLQAADGSASHFYALEGAECEFLRGLDGRTPPGEPAWRFEGHAFSATEPANGQCPANLTPIYRVYNRGFERGLVSNHRYTADSATYEAMQAEGWAAEGVKFCVPPVSDPVSRL